MAGKNTFPKYAHFVLNNKKNVKFYKFRFKLNFKLTNIKFC